MTDLAPMTAFGSAVPREQSFAQVLLRDCPGLALASLAVARDMSDPAPFGLTLPQAGGLVAGPGGIGAFWMGDRLWMIEGQNAAEQDFASRVAAEVPAASVTEQTDGWVAIDVLGLGGASPVSGLLERLVNLAPATLKPGCAARTSLHHLSVFVLRRSDDHATILGPRSAAGSLWHALAEAAQRLET